MRREAEWLEQRGGAALIRCSPEAGQSRLIQDSQTGRALSVLGMVALLLITLNNGLHAPPCNGVYSPMDCDLEIILQNLVVLHLAAHSSWIVEFIYRRGIH